MALALTQEDLDLVIPCYLILKNQTTQADTAESVVARIVQQYPGKETAIKRVLGHIAQNMH